MPKGIKKTEIQKQLERLEYLKASGFEIPEQGLEYLREQRRIETGVYEVLACSTCGEYLEMFIPTSFAMCRCGKNLKQVWVNEYWLRDGPAAAAVNQQIQQPQQPKIQVQSTLKRTKLNLTRSSRETELSPPNGSSGVTNTSSSPFQA